MRWRWECSQLFPRHFGFWKRRRDEETQRRSGIRKENEMAMVRTYRDLVAWQKSMTLAKPIYRATARMPKGEQFGLTQQIRRAVVSIPSNIAEGFGRQSRPDLLKFLRIARGSLNETATQLELAVELRMLNLDTMISQLFAE